MRSSLKESVIRADEILDTYKRRQENCQRFILKYPGSIKDASAKAMYHLNDTLNMLENNIDAAYQAWSRGKYYDLYHAKSSLEKIFESTISENSDIKELMNWQKYIHENLFKIENNIDDASEKLKLNEESPDVSLEGNTDNLLVG